MMKKELYFMKKNLIIVFLACLVLCFAYLTYIYFYSHTKPVEFLCDGGNLCYSVMPRIISSLSKTFLVFTFLLIIAIVVLLPFVYRKKVSKSWVIFCIFLLSLIIIASLAMHFVTRPL